MMVRDSLAVPSGWTRIGSLQDYRYFLEADLQAHGLSKWRFFLAPKYPELSFQRLLRYVEYLQSRRGWLAKSWYVVQRLRLARRSVLTGISIPPGVFGPGLSIAHFGSIVVNDRAKVGAWCRIHSGTNIGVSGGETPQIGSFVYIGPGAAIFGGVTVGDRVAIGANAVVTKDVADNLVVAGVPAKVIGDSGSAAALPEWFPPVAPEERG